MKLSILAGFVAAAAAQSEFEVCQRTALTPGSVEHLIPTGLYNGNKALTMQCFKSDPPGGRSGPVILTFPGGFRPLTDFDVIVPGILDAGYSIMRCGWPTTHAGYNNDDGLAVGTMTTEETSRHWVLPPINFLRNTMGHSYVYVLALQLANRLIRAAGFYLRGHIDGIILGSSGDAPPSARGFDSEAETREYKNTSQPMDVRCRRMKIGFFGPDNQDLPCNTPAMTPGGYAGSWLDLCISEDFGGPYIQHVFFSIMNVNQSAVVTDDGATFGQMWGAAGCTPMYCVMAQYDLIAPVGYSCDMFSRNAEAACPTNTVEYTEVSAGHFYMWEDPPTFQTYATNYVTAHTRQLQNLPPCCSARQRKLLFGAPNRAPTCDASC